MTPDPELESHAPDETEWELDPGIRRAVLVLRRAGVQTNESCQGGEGHSYPVPTVSFSGDAWEGYRAFSVAMEHGLPVSSLRRVYDVLDLQLNGPWWEMTFRTMGD